jgi:hypothetical protein
VTSHRRSSHREGSATIRASMRGISRAVASVPQKFDRVSQNRYSDPSTVPTQGHGEE